MQWRPPTEKPVYYYHPTTCLPPPSTLVEGQTVVSSVRDTARSGPTNDILYHQRTPLY